MENALRTCCIGVKIGKILIDRVTTDRTNAAVTHCHEQLVLCKRKVVSLLLAGPAIDMLS